MFDASVYVGRRRRLREQVGSGVGEAWASGAAGAVTVGRTVEGASGRVTGAEVSGDFSGAEAECMSAAARGLTFSPFGQAQATLTQGYRL